MRRECFYALTSGTPWTSLQVQPLALASVHFQKIPSAHGQENKDVVYALWE